jgi:hypothetical protein
VERLDQASIERIEQDVRERFPEGTLHSVAVKQYGDDPSVEPGEIAIRVTVESPAEEDEANNVFDAFQQTHKEAVGKLRSHLKQRFPQVRRLEFVSNSGPLQRFMKLRLAADEPAGDLTPVMARLGPMDLETLDTLITAGIAANRAQGVRWALARIRDRPAYAQLRERAREIEELKSQF